MTVGDLCWFVTDRLGNVSDQVLEEVEVIGAGGVQYEGHTSHRGHT